MSEKLLKTAEVAGMLGVEVGTVSRYVREGHLPAATTLGGHYRFRESDVIAFMSGGLQKSRAIILALANQKGGVGKTTAVANLAVLLAQMGLRVLVVDLDPQGHLTFTFGYDQDNLELTIYNTMLDRKLDVHKVIVKTAFGVDLAPINIVASNADRAFTVNPTWGTELARVMEGLRDEYDYILFDAGPSLDTLTVNALYATDFVAIPTQLEMLSVKGLQLLLDRIEEARAERANPRLQIAGVIPMMVQKASAHRYMAQALRGGLNSRGIRVFKTPIKRSMAFADVANNQQIMCHSNPRSDQTRGYKLLLAALLKIMGGPGLQLIEPDIALELEEIEHREVDDFDKLSSEPETAYMNKE